MEIALLNPTTLRFKSKLASLVVDPTEGKAKIQADATILMQSKALVEVEGSRVTISGPGEYEVGGVKITGARSAESVIYYFTMDLVTVLVATASSIKAKESLRDVDIAVLLAESVVDPSALATVASGAAVFYGPEAVENIKVLGKEVAGISKYVITKDKMPAEMEAILLA